MGEFFRGWRRKTGLVLFVMALTTMMCWLRSSTTRDQFTIALPHGKSFIAISRSGHCSFAVMRGRVFGSETWNRTTTTQPKWGCGESQEFDADQMASAFHLMMGLPRNGISLCESRFSFYWEARESKWMFGCWIPYWSIVFPLTLLSASLLLSKPRKSTSKRIAEPITVEGK